MGKYTNDETNAQQIKTATAKSDVLAALQEFEMALCECIASASTEEVEADTRLGMRFDSLRVCMEQMRTGVLQLQGVVREQWPEITPLDTVIRNHLQAALEHYGWNKSATAEALHIDRRTVIRMVERFELTPLAPMPDEELVLRCDECGAISEPGELEPRLMHTHSCPLAETAEPGAVAS